MSAAGRFMRLAGCEEVGETVYLFWCPACEMVHPYRTRGAGPMWAFNGDLEKPSFEPSLLVHDCTPSGGNCHLYVTGGEIRYCADSAHALAGQNVPMVPINENWEPA